LAEEGVGMVEVGRRGGTVGVVQDVSEEEEGRGSMRMNGRKGRSAICLSA